MLNRLLRNPVLANNLMVILLAGGAVGLFIMVKESFPDFDLNFISIEVPYPGADPDEIEDGICRPIEEALEGLQGIKTIHTIAAESIGRAIVELTDGADLQTVKEDVRNQIDTITIFPQKSEKPIITDIRFGHQVTHVAIWGDLAERQLKELAYQVKDELVAIPGVSRTDIVGTRDYQISIEISEAKLRQFGLTFDQVADAVSRSSLNLPAGSIRTETEDLKIRILERKYFAAEFNDVIVLARPDGTIIRLPDIADVRDSFDQDFSAYARFNGRPAVNIVVLKTRKEDSIRIAKAVSAYVEKKAKELPPAVHLNLWLDHSRLIQDRIDLLVRNGSIGLFLVFLILWMFSDLRLSFWVTLGIPISLGGGIAIMALTGQSINMISLFGLIMVLGIIVDDAIVVGESIYCRRDQGVDTDVAVVEGTREVMWPVFAAVLTSITAFCPLFFVSGVIGKFIAVLPGPVVGALFISLFEALLILPVHLRHLPRPNVKKEGVARFNPFYQLRRFFSQGLVVFVNKIYGPVMDHLLRWRYATLAASVAVLLVTVGLIRGGIVKFVFFPSSDDDFLVAQVELPNGTPIAETERVTQQLMAAWRETKPLFESKLGNKSLDVAYFSVTGGTMGTGDEPPARGDHITEVFIELLPAEQRNIYYKDIIRTWREKTGLIPAAVSATFSGIGGGPPGGNIEIELLGFDQNVLVTASEKLMAHLTTYNGVYEIKSNFQPGKRELRIALKPSARSLGLTLADVAGQLRQGFYGAEVSRIQRGRDEIKIMVRYPEAERRSLGDLEDIRIRTPDGQEIPFHMVAAVTLQEGYATIRREQGKRLITVTAEADKTANTEEIMGDLFEGYMPELAATHRIIARRGANSRERINSIRSMAKGSAVALLLIYLIMSTIFKSYLQPALIMLTIPFGLVGATVGHILYGLPLTMMSFFGMVALTGIVVNDSIILIVAINERVSGGMPFFEAIREGGKRRFRAIVLTSMTTFGGLAPMIVEKSFQAQFLIPMALSIAFGVAFATLSTLIVVPCMLAALNDLRRVVHSILRFRVPTREEVEPSIAV